MWCLKSHSMTYVIVRDFLPSSCFRSVSTTAVQPMAQAKCKGQSQSSSLPQLFESNSRLYSNQTVDIPNSLLSSCKKGQLFLPVYNFAEAPTWLRRGQILGWMQNVDPDQDLHPLNSIPDLAFQSSLDQSSHDNSPIEPEAPLTNQEQQEKNNLTTTPVKAIVVTENTHQQSLRTEKLKAEFQLDKAAISPEQHSTLENFLLNHADINQQLFPQQHCKPAACLGTGMPSLLEGTSHEA